MTKGMKVEAHRLFGVSDVVGSRHVNCCPRVYPWKDRGSKDHEIHSGYLVMCTVM